MVSILPKNEIIVNHKGINVMIDRQDKHFFDEYNWQNNRNYFDASVALHTLIMNFKPKLDSKLSVDHINRDKLDNRKSNLRIVDKSTQAINRPDKKGYFIRNKSWVGELLENGETKSKSFSIEEFGYENAKKMAKEYRKELLSECKYNGKLKYEETTNIIFEGLEQYVEYKGKKILVDKEDKHYLEEYSWNYDSCGYLITKIRLHHLIINFKPVLDKKLSVDHKNNNPLDNTRNNLRIVNKTIQMINRGKRKDNTSGVIGVYFDEKYNRWRCEWVDNGVKKTKSFAVIKYGGYENAKKLAIEYRAKMISQIESYKIALNL